MFAKFNYKNCIFTASYRIINIKAFYLLSFHDTLMSLIQLYQIFICNLLKSYLKIRNLFIQKIAYKAVFLVTTSNTFNPLSTELHYFINKKSGKLTKNSQKLSE